MVPIQAANFARYLRSLAAVAQPPYVVNTMIASLSSLSLSLAESGRLPDWVLRAGIRVLLRQRLASLPTGGSAAGHRYLTDFLADMAAAPIALVPDTVNLQHYEVPAAFFEKVLGQRRKYSSCLWPDGVTTLDEAEKAALHETCVHADLSDGQTILELGCGWGSLSLWMAEHYPNSRIVGVSNSGSQRASILARAGAAGYANLTILTHDMNEFTPGQRFDRIVSVEMFEHMRNWQRLFHRINDWLNPDGRFLMHVFCHKSLPYTFDAGDSNDWMGQHFFAGGMMPSRDLPGLIESPLQLEQAWLWNGQHYQKTANAWLANMDRQREALWPTLTAVYGEDAARLWWVRWRMFFMACAELFGYRTGNEWQVGHYRFHRTGDGIGHV